MWSTTSGRPLAHLESLDAEYYGRTRTGDIMARLTKRSERGPHGGGPGHHVTRNNLPRDHAIAFMLWISPALTGLALLPMILLPRHMVRLGRVIHDRSRPCSALLDITSFAQETCRGRASCVRTGRSPLSSNGSGTLNDEYLRRNMRLAYLYGG